VVNPGERIQGAEEIVGYGLRETALVNKRSEDNDMARNE
jgi:hypothetical protein